MPTTGTGSEIFCYTTLRYYASPLPFDDVCIRSSETCLNRIRQCLELEAKSLNLGLHLAYGPLITKFAWSSSERSEGFDNGLGRRIRWLHREASIRRTLTTQIKPMVEWHCITQKYCLAIKNRSSYKS